MPGDSLERSLRRWKGASWWLFFKRSGNSIEEQCCVDEDVELQKCNVEQGEM